MKKLPIGGAFEAPPPGEHRLGAMQRLGGVMRRFAPSEEVDYCIVGVGSAGGVLAQRLARAGFRVVALEAGPFWDTERDWVSDEKGSHKLYWTDLRITGGTHPLTFGENNSGRGVGGGSVHWAAFTPRLHPSDFRVYSEDGVGADWPLTYDELRPYYELLEREMPVSGPAYFPWGHPHGYAFGPHPMAGCGDILIEGCTKLGIGVSIGGPVAILAGSRGDRPHCIYRGFCIQGCKVGAKQSTLVSHVPDAVANGAEIRAHSMAARIEIDKERRVTGVHYFDREGAAQFQRARAVIVSGYAIETPRLLLNSASPEFPTGLANSSGTVGRYLMAQAGNVVLGRFSRLVRMYKGPPAHAMTEEFYETDPSRGFARGFAIQTVGPLPIAFSKQMIAAKGLWGWGLRQAMMDYNHWGSIALLGELLPNEANRVELAEERDHFGLRVPKITFGLFDNDKKLIEYGKNKTIDVMRAAGAEEVIQESRFAHLVGAARMGSDPSSSVVDKFCRTHDVDNLFVCDGSVFPTQGSANPGLTIQALAARTADFLIAQGDAIFRRGAARSLERPAMRTNLSPPATFGHGVPPSIECAVAFTSRRRFGVRQELLLAVLPTIVVLGMLAGVEAFSRQRLLFASLAASAFLIYLDPDHPANAVRTVTIAQSASALIGFGAYWLLGAGYVAAAIAMVVTVVLMVLAEATHPPAVSTALTFAFRPYPSSSLSLFGLSILLIVILVVMQRAASWMVRRHERTG